MSRNLIIILVVILLIAIGGGTYFYSLQPTSVTDTQTQAISTQITGKIDQKGSDTLLILAQRWGEEFMNKPEFEDVRISVSGGGSGTGIAALINGEIDLADSSRQIKQEEKDLAKDRGITPVEWKVALDGISVIVNPENPLTELTLEEIKNIYTGTTKYWSEFGSNEGKITTYGRQSNSGTYVFFQEHVLEKEDYRSDMQSLNGNADLVEAVSKDENGIGYVGIAYAEQRAEDVKIIKIKRDLDAPSITPSLETIADGSYPISRFLYIYSNGTPTREVAAYLKYIISDEGQAITEEVGYIPLTDEIQEQQLSKLE